MKTLELSIVAVLMSVLVISIQSVNGLLLTTPLEQWMGNHIILDGTVLSSSYVSTEKLIQYNIKVNKFFKNQQSVEMITAYGPSHDNQEIMYPKFLNVGDRALFYLNKIGEKYVISMYSVKSTPSCNPRDSIGLSTLPGEPTPRGGPELYYDPYQKCNPYFPSVDYLKSTLSPLKQLKAGIKMGDIGCKNEFQLVIKSEDNFPACVKPQTKIKLMERGWAMSSLIGLGTDQGVFQSAIKMPVGNMELQCENEFKPREFQHIVFPNGTSLTINYVPVFLIKPDSTGKICTNNWKAMPEMNYSGKVITGIGKGDSTTHDVSVVADPDTITIEDTNKTIVYTITASKDASGFYRFSPMFSDCGGIPIAIGYNSTHSFDNDFPWLWDVLPCPLNKVNVQITGFSGIDVVYITKEYR